MSTSIPVDQTKRLKELNSFLLTLLASDLVLFSRPAGVGEGDYKLTLGQLLQWLVDGLEPIDLSSYAPLASPALMGTPTAPTPASNDNSTRLATTAFAQTLITAINQVLGSLLNLGTTDKTSVVAAINSVLTELHDLENGLANILIADSAIEGTDKTWSIDKISDVLIAFKQDILGGIPPEALNTIAELAAQLQNEEDAVAGIISSLANKISVDAQSFTTGQKTQARTNIGAAAQADVDSISLALSQKLDAAGVWALALTGLSTASGADVTATDSILTAIGKLQAKAAAVASNVLSTVLTGLSTSSSTDVTATDTVLIAIGKLQAKAAAVASNVLSTALTGLSTATNSAVVATDSVLVAIGKLQAQLANYLTIANSRYSFNTQTGTTYALVSSDVTSNGRVIVRFSSASFTNLTLPTPTSLGATTGDSVQVQITATYTAQTLVAGSGAAAEGALTFSRQWHTKTLIVKDSTTWIVVG